MSVIVTYSSACIILVGGEHIGQLIKFIRVVLMRFIVTYSSSCIIPVG